MWIYGKLLENTLWVSPEILVYLDLELYRLKSFHKIRDRSLPFLLSFIFFVPFEIIMFLCPYRKNTLKKIQKYFILLLGIENILASFSGPLTLKNVLIKSLICTVNVFWAMFFSLFTTVTSLSSINFNFPIYTLQQHTEHVMSNLTFRARRYLWFGS